MIVNRPYRLARSARPLLLGCVLLSLLALPAPLGAEGSASIYPEETSSPFRANIEWRTTFYGSSDSPDFNIFRRTLLKVYAEAGEHILVASSGVGSPGTPSLGDVRIFNPGEVTGPIGDERFPALAGTPATPQPGAFANGFSCRAQRAVAGNGDRGRIGSRAAELAGPNTENNLRPEGYRPCLYTAPVTGIYNVIFSGPSGEGSNVEPALSGAMTPTAADLGVNQRTSVTAWDVSVRRDLNALATEPGRAFTYYVAGNTGGGGRNVIGSALAVTDYGFIYEVTYAGDPFGFIIFANQIGYRDSDGSPLYHAVLADPRAPTQDQNELKELQGGVQIQPPEYPLFFDTPYPPLLDALGIPREPIIPAIASLLFAGSERENISRVGGGGTFTFQTNQPGVYTIVISRDGTDFQPENPRNRLLRGIAEAPGTVSVSWNGRANDGELFPVGDYLARAVVQGGEIHFPFLDVENNTPGGPVIELTNPPDRDGDGQGDCPPWVGGCFGAFYDDRGYVTANGTLVGTGVNQPLCNDGAGNPPRVLATDPLLGYDTRTDQRAFGFPYNANPESICLPTGGYGDKKGLDLWTFYPSNQLVAPLRIIDPTAVTLRSFTAATGPEGVTVRWETGSERGTLGFHLLRASSADRSEALRVTPDMILARGGPTEGARYHWDEPLAPPGVRYFYWLQELEEGGTTREYGPARTAPSVSAQPFRVALPFIR